MERITMAIALAVLTVSAVTDVLYLKVPNGITFPAILAGLALSGFPVTRESGERMLWLLLFFMGGSLRIMGMGDLKLCMAVLSLRGIDEVWKMLLAGSAILFAYCMASDTENTCAYVKELAGAAIYRTRVTRHLNTPTAAYPFALFLALGYTANFVI